ncbi:MAG TPA: PLP-dependent aminotransferase family protein, partial [Acetobacteraceae bacterium]|nr:PLP-dependent aminotransferase family protein [Acetobacteraceae bacterium]
RWTEEALIRALAARHVAVTPSDPFVAGGRPPAGGVRVCIGGRLSPATLREALESIRATLLQLPPVNQIGTVA